MAFSNDKVLAPQVILRAISRKALPGTALSQLFGWNIGMGPVPGAMMLPGIDDDTPSEDDPRGNTLTHVGRTGQYDYFDIDRKVASGTFPDSPATIIPHSPAGYVQFTIPRSAQRKDETYERMMNRRPVGGPASMYDTAGQRYLLLQFQNLAQQTANLVEFQTAAMLRGEYYFIQRGDTLYHSFTNQSVADKPVLKIDYQIPAGNKTQLGGAISATWESGSANIPSQVYAVNAKSLEDTGMGIQHIIVNSVTWQYVTNDSFVKALAGTYEPFEMLTQEQIGVFSCKLKGMPQFKWHIVDYGLETWADSTATWTWEKLIPDGFAVFLPTPNSTWTHYIKGAEYVVERPGAEAQLRTGFYAYEYPVGDPAARRLFTHLNGFPALPIPKAIYYADVVFT